MHSFKKTFEILCCIIVGIVISFISRWENETIQAIYSTLILIFLLIGFLKVVKGQSKVNPNEKENDKEKDRDINVIDFVISNQKPIKIVRLSQNPTQVGEELGEIFIETMKGGKCRMGKIKNFFKRLWGNKFTILSIALSSFSVVTCEYLYFADYFLRFDWFAKNQIVLNYVLPVIGIGYLVVVIYTSITKYGWESLEELKTKLAQKALEKASRLTSAQKAVIKNQIKEIKNAISTISIDLERAEEIIKNFEVLQSLGNIVPITQDKIALYNKAVSDKPSLEAQYSNLKLQLSQLQEALK